MSAQVQKPAKWWQWVLLYPVLATSLLAAIPTYIELYRSKKYDVEFGASAKAAQQDAMWRKNLSCSAAPFDWMTNDRNVRVDATICRSGDVLVRGEAPGNISFYEWVDVDQLSTRPARASTLSTLFTARADEAPRIILAQAPTVLCQKWLDQGRLLRRVSIAGRGCFDEIVNTFNGYVISSQPAPCNAQC